jgi:hypothetical protein
MDSSHPAPSPQVAIPPEQRPPGLWFDAIRFWEFRRLIYNLVLTAAVLAWLLATWPHFRPAFTLLNFLRLVILGLIANVLYCSAYVVDVPLLHSPLGPRWRSRRWVLWAVGMLLAFLLTNYWIADEIYPDFR